MLPISSRHSKKCKLFCGFVSKTLHLSPLKRCDFFVSALVLSCWVDTNYSWIMVSSKTVVILALSRYIIRNYSEATQNWTEASTLLPWQTNMIFIALFFLPELRYYAELCGLLRGSFFLHPFWQNRVKSANLRINTHISDVVSSKIVVEIGAFYY